VDKQRLYRGKGGEIMRGGVSHLIYAMSLARLNFTPKELHALFKVLLENFRHPNHEIQEEATKAFHAFCASYFESNEQIESEIGQTMIKEIQSLFKASN
jgi:hypothetical protein